MRGKKAKLLRRIVYGDKSIKGKRMYATAGNGALVCVGPRREYKFIKKYVMKGRTL